jgi:hypothetical protein
VGLLTPRGLGILGALLLLFGGCGGPGEPADGGVAAFPGSASSLDALGRRVLQALSAGDTASLQELRLSEREHNDVVWPELPASNPEANFPLDFAWRNVQLRNARDLARILTWYRSRELDLERVECRGKVQPFQSFDVMTDCHVVFRSREHGRLEAQIFKDVLVRGGGYKIFRYYDEVPRSSATP